MTKYNIRLVKSIYTPVEIEAENMHEALKKALAMMPETEAYRYLHRYGAISVAHEYYDVMHTQPINDMVESMASYCRRKGGQL